MSTELLAAAESEEQLRRVEFIRGLRECADFLERHPRVPVPWSAELNVFVHDREALAAVARCAAWAKAYNDHYFWLDRKFSGEVSLQVNANREQVCRRVVVGTKVIPAQPEQIVDDVEWICDDALLAPDVAGLQAIQEASR